MTPTTIDRIQSTSLYFREGASDKEYHAAIEPKADGFIVTFAYGRCGNTLTVGTKTEAPVSLDEATKVFGKLIASKIAKGYQSGIHGRPTQPQPTQELNRPYQQTGKEGTDSGIRCQLLNSVDSTELDRLLNDIHYCLQEKHDGRRLMVRKQGDDVIGINRRGLVVAIPEPIREAVAQIPFDVLIDGEAVGETLHAFDLLEVKGNDLRQCRYLDRCVRLLDLLDPADPADHATFPSPYRGMPSRPRLRLRQGIWHPPSPSAPPCASSMS